MGAGQQATASAAIIYCRVSTRRQEDEGTSLDSQEAACIRHAQSLGFTSRRVTREVYSGAELYDRPLQNIGQKAPGFSRGMKGPHG
jgi:hypothetical protein